MDSAVIRRPSVPGTLPGAGEPADLVPTRRTLDGFAQATAASEGINIREAEQLVPILVTTRNSRYRIIPLRRGSADVLIQGGRFFPEPTQVCLAGSTFGGSMIKMHWIMVGMQIEIDAGDGGGPITTTRVADVSVEHHPTVNTRPH